MPVRSYQWSNTDETARTQVARLIENSGLSYRAFADKTDDLIKYSRVRDICLGRSAPMRLSEFLIICDICDADPIETLKVILTSSKQGNIDAQIDVIAANPDKFGFAANHDPNKEIERETPRD